MRVSYNKLEGKVLFYIKCWRLIVFLGEGCSMDSEGTEKEEMMIQGNNG